MRKALALSLVLVCLLGLTIGAQEATTSTVQTCSVQAFFVSPDVDGVIEQELIALINQATSTLDVALYSFTDDQLGAAVIEAHQRGVKVRVFLDDGQEEARGGEYAKLVAAGVSVAVEHVKGLMHHKFAVIDGRIVVTGSYNWSNAADENNFENVVVVECPEIAAAFLEEFERLWDIFAAPVALPPAPSAPPTLVSAAFEIYQVDPQGEKITLRNLSNQPADLGGWRISDGEGSYTFRTGTMVPPGGTYTIGIEIYNPTRYTRGLYLNNKHDEVYLYDQNGNLVDQVTW